MGYTRTVRFAPAPVQEPPGITAELRDAWRFFLEHAGYATPPGRAQCALNLARAELDGREAGLSFGWEYDPDGMPEDGLCSCGCGQEITMCETCICYLAEPDDNNYDVLASIGAIWDATTDYRRIVEAQLAQEALEYMAE